ncbi:MAG: NUDIX domain-containing protein [Pseudomonadota bacterium]
MAPHHSSEEAFLKAYDPSAYERPSTSIDCVIYTVMDNALQVLLVKRAEHPAKGQWSLVGGYVDLANDADLEGAAKRKLHEKTSVKTPYLEQVCTIGNNARDPRGWSVTTVYFALLPADAVTLKTGPGTEDIQWAKVSNGHVAMPLAFDHALLLKRATQRLHNKVLYTSLPIYLMPKQFTLGELQQVYEIILQHPIDGKSFRRRVLCADFLEATDQFKRETKRPARIYRKTRNAPPHAFQRNIEGIRQE